MNQPLLHLRPSDVTPALAALFNPDDPTIARLYGVLDGRAAGGIMANSSAQPAWAVVREAGDGLLYLGGAIEAPLLRDAIAALRADGDVCVGLWPDDPRRDLLPRDPDYAGRTFDFLHRRPDGDRLAGLARRLSGGCHLRSIDRTLLERCAWRDQQIVRCGSLDGFFAHGLGYCVMRGDEILSEAYAGPAARGTMEIGIYTHPAHRGHGYATAACAQTIATCEARGYETFWNCNTSNLASAVLARKMGYGTEREYALAAWFKRAGA